MSSLGMNVSRVDGPAKIRGWAQYTADVELPRMVYAKALRSAYPHARLARVDASRAEKLPGVVAVLTRDDLKGMNAYFGPFVKDQPVVAIDRVRYVGNVIAAVAAEGRDIAEEALDLIEVEYKPLSLAQIVAEELGLPVERVSETFPDTDVTPSDQSTSSEPDDIHDGECGAASRLEPECWRPILNNSMHRSWWR